MRVFGVDMATTEIQVWPWAYSKLKTFETCPKQFYHKYIVKDYKDGETEAMRYGKALHKVAEDYFAVNAPVPEQFAFMEPILKSLSNKQGEKHAELQMGLREDLSPCGFFDKDVWYRGVADLVIIDDNIAWVVDYKTSKNTKYADEGQLELMAMSVYKHFPQVTEVRAALMFVICKAAVKRTYKAEDQHLLWGRWMPRYLHLEKAGKLGTWHPKPSGLCKNHCIVTECPHNGGY